jgi:hypothetical protein
MKALDIAKFRVLIILALTIAAALILLHFHGQPNFFKLSFLSLAVILLINSFLATNWTWVKERKSRYAGIAIPMSIVLVALRYWEAGDRISSVLLVSHPVILALGISRRLFRPIDPRWTYDWGLEPRDTLATVTHHFVPILVWLIVAVRSWLFRSSVWWAVLASTVAIVQLFMVVFMAYLSRKSQRISCNANDPSKAAPDHGGRA